MSFSEKLSQRQETQQLKTRDITKPLWNLDEDGISFSLLGRWIVCRERFRLHAVEGLREHETFNKALEFGNMLHEAFDHWGKTQSIDAATDEETVPEHKYDTLALEASYLAHGQAVRVQECEDDIQCYRNLVLRDSERITVSSYVVVIDEHDQYKHFFMGPRVGGLSVTWNENEIAIVTANAPFGQALMGKEVGDEIEFKVADKQFCYEVISID